MHTNNSLLFLNQIFLFISVIVLSGCGGGGSDDTNKVTPKSLYSGKSTPALLNESNTIHFSQLVFGNAQNSTPLTQSRPLSSNSSALTNQNTTTSKLSAIIAQHADTGLNTLQSRSIQATEHCWYGGSLHKEGQLDDEDDTGTVHLTYINCEAEEGIILDGKASITTHSTEYPESTTTTFDGLTIKEQASSYTLSGEIYNLVDRNDEASTFRWFENRNYVSINDNPELSNFVENLEMEINGTLDEEYSETGSVSGKVYLQNEGYVSLSYANDFLPYFIGRDEIPQQGTSYLSGASNSEARITHTLIEYEDEISNDKYRLDLDQDGDNIFELTSIQNYDPEQASTDFSLNQKPISTIQVYDHSGLGNTYNSAFRCRSELDEAGFRIPSTVFMISKCSTDPENDELSFQWTLESKPDGSSSELLEPSDALDNSISLDVRGTYTVSLKATDISGSGTSDIQFFDIVAPNYQPAIYTINTTFPGSYLYGYFGEIGNSYEITVINQDDVKYIGEAETDYISTSYEWISKPVGSSVDLTLVNKEFENNEEYIHLLVKDTYTVVPDVVGTYRLRFTATDREANTTTTDFEFTMN